MVKCPFCHTTQVTNTIFCSECGRYVLKDENAETLQIAEISWKGDREASIETDSTIQLQPEPVAVRLKIDEMQREIEIPLKKSILLGRVAPAANIFPEVDLSCNGTTKNVSRRHARIVKRREEVIVEDLDSLNGTYINGRKLAPFWPTVLQDGDILQLGNLLIEIELLKQTEPI